ncbi:MAG: porin, partial [Enterobacterales bacterium]|nr:porin [Enterobacterales bacterium]
MHHLKLLSLASAIALIGSQTLAEDSESGRFAIAGYGDVKYEDSKANDTS